MTPTWRSFLESAEGHFDPEVSDVLDFGDAAGELNAATERTVLVPLTHLATLEASGEDARSFLHSQFTSDVNHLAEGTMQHAGWCTAKGRMQASFVVQRTNEGYRLLLAADLLEGAKKRLQMFILRAKVTLTVATDEVLLGVAGAQAVEALQAAGLPCPEAPMSFSVTGATRVLRLDAQRFIVSTPESAAPALWQQLSVKARPAGVPVWRWLDVQAAFPLVTLATKEEFVPQMADFEKIGGVSFHKGCYPGQEIVARTQYLGKVKRHLFRIGSSVALKAGDEIYSPDNLEQACGKVMTAAPAPAGGYVGLAVVQSNHADTLHLGSRDGVPLSAVAVNPA